MLKFVPVIALLATLNFLRGLDSFFRIHEHGMSALEGKTFLQCVNTLLIVNQPDLVQNKCKNIVPSNHLYIDTQPFYEYNSPQNVYRIYQVNFIAKYFIG